MSKTVCRIAAGLCALLIGALPSAQARAQQPVTLNIVSQPLSDALRELATVSNTNIVFEPAMVSGITAPALQGSITPEEALARLLLGTKWSFKFVDENTVSLIPRPRAEAAKADIGGSAQQGMRVAQSKLPSTDDGRNAGDEGDQPADNKVELQAEKLEEIVVTAQKREQRLIDTPISVGVLTGESLDRGSSRGVTDALSQIGGVSISESQPGSTQISVRGIVGGVASGPTGFYLDEVPFSFVRRSLLPDANAFDLARVEVLRGAQGTLYGANSLGGVVRVLTNDANLDAFEAKGRLRTSHTEDADDNYGGDMAVNLPLIPGKLAVRAVAGYSDLTGFTDSTRDGGRRINDSQVQSYRVKVNARPSENITIKLGVTRSDIANGAPSEAFDDFTTPFSSNRPADILLDTYNLVAQYDWSDISLLSSTGYVDYAEHFAGELVLGGAITPVMDDPSLKSFTQELRLTTDFDGPWQWSLGAIYKDTSEKNVTDARAFPLFSQVYRITETSESYAVFGEVTRSLYDDKVELTGGLRYFEDDYLQTQQANFFPGALAPDLLLNFEKLTWRLIATYKLHEDMNIYGSVSTGFRSGIGQTPAILVSQPGFPGIVKPDTVTTYEVGAKGRLFNDAFTYEMAVYYMDWQDIPQNLTIPIGFQARVNASGASGLGAEATVSYQPLPQLTLHASLGWNDLKIDEDVLQHVGAAAPLGTDVVLFAENTRINGSPEWTGSAGGTYRTATPMSDIDIVLSSNFAFGSARDRRFINQGVLNVTKSDTFGNLKASIGVEADRWSLDLYGDNLLNDQGSIDAPDPAALNTSLRLRPRTIGLQATFNY